MWHAIGFVGDASFSDSVAVALAGVAGVGIVVCWYVRLQRVGEKRMQALGVRLAPILLPAGGVGAYWVPHMAEVWRVSLVATLGGLALGGFDDSIGETPYGTASA